MLVISDSSPISNLILVDKIELLHQVVGDVIIPFGVYNEIQKLHDFNINLTLFDSVDWISVRTVGNIDFVNELRLSLDVGEAEAIALSLEIHADFLLIDERYGQSIASKLNIRTIGLIGILIKAKQRGIISEVKPVIDDLIRNAGFWIAKKLYAEVLNKANEKQ